MIDLERVDRPPAVEVPEGVVSINGRGLHFNALFLIGAHPFKLMMSAKKQYGLVLSSRKKPSAPVARSSVFGDSSSDEDVSFSGNCLF